MNAETRQTFSLVAVSGPEKGRTYPLDVPEFLIGKSDAANLRVQDPSVNWRHALIRTRGKALTLEVLTSFGIEVNRLPIKTETRLQHGDSIEISPSLTVRIERNAPQSLSFILRLALGGLALLVALIVVELCLPAADDAAQPLSEVETLGIATQLAGVSDRNVFSDKISSEFSKLFHHAVDSERLGFREEETSSWHKLMVLLDRRGIGTGKNAGDSAFVPAPPSKLRSLLANPDAVSTLSFDQYIAAVVGITRARLSNLHEEP